jgi:hypothetical protein
MLVINFTNVPFRLSILIVLAIAISINQIFLTRSIFKRNLVGQIIIHAQKKSLSFTSILLAIVWTIFAISGQKNDIFIAFLFWTFVIGDLVSKKIYKKEKPIYFVVNNGQLIINDIWLLKRDIATLTKISLNGLTDNITLSFAEKSNLKFNRNNFDYEDVKMLVNFLKMHSKQSVTISENLKIDITAANIALAVWPAGQSAIEQT